MGDVIVPVASCQMKFASVIPLDYGTHVEEAVTILDTDWENLLRVLEKPNTYLSDCMRNDFQLDPRHRPWTLRNPTVAELVDIETSCPFESAFFGFAEEHFNGAPTNSFEKFDKAEDSDKKATSKGLFKDLTSMAPFNNGFFMLRFAIDTAILHIGYVARPAVNHYQGGLTPVTQSLCGTRFGSRTGSLHVDLEPNASISDFKVLIANYVFDAVSNFKGHLGRITKQPAVRYNPAQIRGRGQENPSGGQIPLQLKEPMGHALEADYIIRPSSTGPTITVEWLSDDPIPIGYTPCVYYPECKCCVDPSTGLPIYDVPGMVCKLYQLQQG